MVTTLYSVLHMLVDCVCALAMFGCFCEGRQGYLYILLYNFCAFAMQMPLGVFLDLTVIRETKKRRSTNFAYLYAVVGVIFTVIGALTHPVILGMGNAFFHVGAGADVIGEDRMHQWKGQALGIFVAPGALGLYIGGLIGKQADIQVLFLGLIFASFIMFWVLGMLFINVCRSGGRLRQVPDSNAEDRMKKPDLSARILISCILVVILRSYIGMAVIFSWKTTVMMGFISVMAVVLGKMAGGILAARYGMRKVIVLSLVLAGVCYYFDSYAVFGIAALFFFNMTMPITLYLLVERFKKLPGFAFGLLTFALFLGFLPVYYEIDLPITGELTGLVGSLASLILLLAVTGGKGEKKEGGV